MPTVLVKTCYILLFTFHIPSSFLLLSRSPISFRLYASVPRSTAPSCLSPYPTGRVREVLTHFPGSLSRRIGTNSNVFTLVSASEDLPLLSSHISNKLNSW